MRASSCFLFATSLALSVASFGCSSSDDAAPTGDASADASDVSADVKDTTVAPRDTADDDVSTDVGSDAGCNGVKNIALAVTENNVAANLPSGEGGLIADGIYVVTAITRYNGPGGKVGPGTRVVEETISITDGKVVQGVRKIGDAPGYGYNANIAPVTGTILWKQTCPAGEPGITYDYSVGDQTFDLYDKVQKVGTTYTHKILTPP